MTALIYVNFTDETRVAIDAVFGGPQEIDVWPNHGTVHSDDPVYVDYYSAQTPFMRQWLIKPGD